MGSLIIIRGPIGSGKTTLANTLIAKLGQGYLLKLDEVKPEIFQAYLKCSTKYENVIAEMFFGNSHTTNPEEWLSHFPRDKYRRLSVLLVANLEDCIAGIIGRKFPSHWTVKLDVVRDDYYEFYGKYKPIFRCLIDFPEMEIIRTSDPNALAEQIIARLSGPD